MLDTLQLLDATVHFTLFLAHNFPCNIDCTDGSIKLIPYDSYSETVGRVEVCVDGTWGSICSRFFTNSDAQVVCKQLGHTALGKLDEISIGIIMYNIIV